MEKALITARVRAIVSDRQGAEHLGQQLGIVRVPILAAPGVTEDLAVVALDRDIPGELRLVPVSRVRPA